MMALFLSLSRSPMLLSLCRFPSRFALSSLPSLFALSSYPLPLGPMHFVIRNSQSEIYIAYWQTKRDRTQRGIVEVVT
jgi:hypothetical protein